MTILKSVANARRCLRQRCCAIGIGSQACTFEKRPWYRTFTTSCVIFVLLALVCATVVDSGISTGDDTATKVRSETLRNNGKSHRERVNAQLKAMLSPLHGSCLQHYDATAKFEVRWCHGSAVYVRNTKTPLSLTKAKLNSTLETDDWQLIGVSQTNVTVGPEFDVDANLRYYADRDSASGETNAQVQSQRTGTNEWTWTSWAPLPDRAVETFSRAGQSQHHSQSQHDHKTEPQQAPKPVIVDIRCCHASHNNDNNNNNNDRTFIHGVHVGDTYNNSQQNNNNESQLSVNVTVCSPLLCPKPPTAQQSAVLRAHVRDLFDHAHSSYMTNAWPWDELCPLSCTPRRWDDKSRGDLDDNLGGFSLTLVDSLDALAIVGDLDGFFDALDRVQEYVHFDRDVEVSVFESTIRVLGGLLSAHMLLTGPLSTYPEALAYQYDGTWLLELATDLATRLLVAFDTPTGIPYHRVNLRRGVLPDETKLTCTAAAGTLLVEWGVLSRLTGDVRFERAAKNAVRALWARRTGLNLMGNTIDVETGRWTSTHSGSGAGVDSFFEYLMKAYVILGDAECLEMFDSAYAAASEHYAFGPWHIDVNMFEGKAKPVGYIVSALQAFWPGMQVLAGLVPEAVRSHFAFMNLWAVYGAIPDAYDLASQATTRYGKAYHLRPELAESTMHLYAATRNPVYLEFGREMLERLEAMSRVECGFASLRDVATGELEDRMDSFLTSETLKYLYILFDLGAKHGHAQRGNTCSSTTSRATDEATHPDNTRPRSPLSQTQTLAPPRGSWGEWADPLMVMYTTEGHVMWLGTPGLRDGSETRSKLSSRESHLLHHSTCPMIQQRSYSSSGEQQVEEVGGDEGRRHSRQHTCSSAEAQSYEQRGDQIRSFSVADKVNIVPSGDSLPSSPLLAVPKSVRVTLSVRKLVSALAATRNKHHRIDKQDGAGVAKLPQPRTVFTMVLSGRGAVWPDNASTNMVLMDAIPSQGCSSLVNTRAIKFALRRTHNANVHASGGKSSGNGRSLSVGVLVDHGGCSLDVKARHVAESGAQALIVIRRKNKADGNINSIDEDVGMNIEGEGGEGGADQDSKKQSRPILIGAIPENIGRLIQEHPHLLFSSRSSVGSPALAERDNLSAAHWMLQVPNQATSREQGGGVGGGQRDGGEARGMGTRDESENVWLGYVQQGVQLYCEGALLILQTFTSLLSRLLLPIDSW